MGPFQIVRPGLLPSHTLDQILKPRPEPQLLQGIVQPACGDAEVCLVGGNVMDAMVLAGQDDVAVL